MKKSLSAFIAGAIALLSACDDQAPAAVIPLKAAPSDEVLSLRKQVATLEAQIKDLRATPAVMLAAVEASRENLADATAAAEALKAKYPISPERATADKLLAQLTAARDKRDADAKRIAALGMRALPVNKRFDGDEAALAISGAALGTMWTFDAHGDRFHYLKPEKGARFVTARVTASSKNKDPKLPGLALYSTDGANLIKQNDFEYRFVRWSDYGSYLGNSSDYRNDFAHSSSIALTIAASIEDSNIKRPLYLVATRAGCYHSDYERFKNPPMSYVARNCDALKSSLTATDFVRDGLVVVHRID